jgi:diguanylate cyclase (GGDEF)-like protein
MVGPEPTDRTWMQGEPRDLPDEARRNDARAVAALAVVIASGCASFIAITAGAASWVIGLAGALTLGATVALMTWGGLVRPLQRQIATERRWRRAAEAELAERLALDRLLGQVDVALSMAASESEVLDILGRGLHALTRDRQAAVLLASAEEARCARWRLDAGPNHIGRPVELTSPGVCRSLARGATTVTPSNRDLDACEHVASDPDDVSSVCVPVPLAEGVVGVVNILGPTGDLPDAATLAAIERLARTAGDRIDRLRSTAGEVQSILDPITGLPNHTSFRRELLRCIGELTPFSVALCDLDGFGPYNEEHGRDAGDKVLRSFASGLSETLRPGDVCCRYDADVFAVMFPRCSPAQAQAALERVREALVLRAAEAGEPPYLWSAGIADSNQGTSVDELLDAADVALVVAKHAGGNRVRTADLTAETASPELGD